MRLCLSKYTLILSLVNRLWTFRNRRFIVPPNICSPANYVEGGHLFPIKITTRTNVVILGRSLNPRLPLAIRARYIVWQPEQHFASWWSFLNTVVIRTVLHTRTCTHTCIHSSSNFLTHYDTCTHGCITHLCGPMGSDQRPIKHKSLVRLRSSIATRPDVSYVTRIWIEPECPAFKSDTLLNLDTRMDNSYRILFPLSSSS